MIIDAVERGFDIDGVAYAPLRKWTETQRGAAWDGLGAQEKRNIQNRFSSLLAVYYALVNRDENKIDGGVWTPRRHWRWRGRRC